jgi:hypothetical protein
LALQAMLLAEQARTRDKVRRLGLVLVHAAEAGPNAGAENAEDMLGLAMAVFESDVRVLRRCPSIQSQQIGRV